MENLGHACEPGVAAATASAAAAACGLHWTSSNQFCHRGVLATLAVLRQESPPLTFAAASSPAVSRSLYQVSPTQASFARYTPAPPGTSRGISPEQAKQAVLELCSEYGSPVPEMAAALRPADIHVGELWSMPPNKVLRMAALRAVPARRVWRS